jgi:tetratricopeptide (TPR) repeat protein
MDGRWKLAVAGSVILSGLVGCKSDPNVLEMPPPVSSSKPNSIYVPEPPDVAAKKDGPISSSTVIVYANMCVEVVAKDPNKPAGEREHLLSQARQMYQDTLQHEPKNVDALLGLGQLYRVSGETAKLNEVMQKATSQHGNDPKVWAWLAKQNAMSNNWPAAIECYQHCCKLDPDNRMYRINLGFTLARAGRYQEGYECLSRSMREAEARYNVAQMMTYNGEVDKARVELHLALQADPNFNAANDKLASLPNAGAPGNSDVRTVGYEQPAPASIVRPLMHEERPASPATGPLIRQGEWPQPSMLLPRTGSR